MLTGDAELTGGYGEAWVACCAGLVRYGWHWFSLDWLRSLSGLAMRYCFSNDDQTVITPR